MIEHITIQTNKFEEEIQFYNKYLSIGVQIDMRNQGRNMVFLGKSKTDTLIEVIENLEIKETNNENISIGFKVKDLEEKQNLLQKEGFSPTKIISPNKHIHFFFVKDPAGMNVQFIEE